MAFRLSDLAAGFALAALLLAAPAGALEIPSNAPPPVAGGLRGVWIWKTEDLLASAPRQSELAEVAHMVGITDLFLSIHPRQYRDLQEPLHRFIALMGKSGIKVWALDGCRCYFADADGSKLFFTGLRAMLDYNYSATAAQRFVGFQTDIEPQDDKGFKPSFHNEIPQSKLDPGQAADRQALLADWLSIHKQAAEMLHERHLRLGAAMPFWTESYGGEPVTVEWDGAVRPVGQAMMAYLDDEIIMSYNTDPANAAARVAAQAAYASTLPADHRPRISASMETDREVGATISYGDTPGKQSKAVLLADMGAIQDKLAAYPAFAGVSIEDWTGFLELPR